MPTQVRILPPPSSERDDERSGVTHPVIRPAPVLLGLGFAAVERLVGYHVGAALQPRLPEAGLGGWQVSSPARLACGTY